MLLGIFLIMRFEAILAIAWSLSGYKELKLTTKLFIGCRLLIETKYELSKFGHAENSYFRVSTRFLRKFLGQYYMVFASFSGPLDWIVHILVWFERSLHPAQVRWQSCPWELRWMTSQVDEGMWIHLGGSGANGLIHSFSLLFAVLNCKFSLFLIHRSFFGKKEVRCWNM